MISKKSDDAVSPVVGVMLMVVITVVIAAVITTFATGVATDAEAAPTAVLDVEIYDYYQALSDCGGPDFHITQISGDALDTKDLEIRVSWEDQTGKQHYSTYSAEAFKENKGSVEGAGGVRKQPMYIKTQVTGDMRKDFGSSALDYYFGDAILKPGLKLTATADFLDRTKGKNLNSPFMDVIFNNGEDLSTERGIMEFLPEGTAVNVMILHTPSNKAIFDKVVYVE